MSDSFSGTTFGGDFGGGSPSFQAATPSNFVGAGQGSSTSPAILFGSNGGGSKILTEVYGPPPPPEPAVMPVSVQAERQEQLAANPGMFDFDAMAKTPNPTDAALPSGPTPEQIAQQEAQARADAEAAKAQAEAEAKAKAEADAAAARAADEARVKAEALAIEQERQQRLSDEPEEPLPLPQFTPEKPEQPELQLLDPRGAGEVPAPGSENNLFGQTPSKVDVPTGGDFHQPIQKPEGINNAGPGVRYSTSEVGETVLKMPTAKGQELLNQVDEFLNSPASMKMEFKLPAAAIDFYRNFVGSAASVPGFPAIGVGIGLVKATPEAFSWLRDFPFKGIAADGSIAVSELAKQIGEIITKGNEYNNTESGTEAMLGAIDAAGVNGERPAWREDTVRNADDFSDRNSPVMSDAEKPRYDDKGKLVPNPDWDGKPAEDKPIVTANGPRQSEDEPGFAIEPDDKDDMVKLIDQKNGDESTDYVMKQKEKAEKELQEQKQEKEAKAKQNDDKADKKDDNSKDNNSKDDKSDDDGDKVTAQYSPPPSKKREEDKADGKKNAENKDDNKKNTEDKDDGKKAENKKDDEDDNSSGLMSSNGKKLEVVNYEDDDDDFEWSEPDTTTVGVNWEAIAGKASETKSGRQDISDVWDAAKVSAFQKELDSEPDDDLTAIYAPESERTDDNTTDSAQADDRLFA